MIDYSVCFVGFAIGLFVGSVASLLNNIISGLFSIMKG